jgi:hypothetical protein
MKAKHVFVLILGAVAVGWFIWAVFDWGSSPKYDPTISKETLKTLLANRGLDTCTETDLYFDKVPGFVQGKTMTVSSHCNKDTNPLKLSLLEFDSEESRNAAQQRAAGTHRNGFGPHFAYSYGPFVVTVQGTRGVGDQVLLGKILKNVDDNSSTTY